MLRWIKKLIKKLKFKTPPMDTLRDKVYKEEVKISPNKGGKIQPKFIVLHHSAGSFKGTVSYIMKKSSRVSYHYIIDPSSGDLIQMVWDSRRAWHAGKSKWNGRSGLNSCSVGISFSGDTNKRDVADYEIDSCAKKCIYLMDKFHLGIDSIVTHQMISPGRKNDCSEDTYNKVIDRIKILENTSPSVNI